MLRGSEGAEGMKDLQYQLLSFRNVTWSVQSLCNVCEGGAHLLCIIVAIVFLI